jgi:type 1 glutamine amidotransferase/nicotinamidase-related amidase
MLKATGIIGCVLALVLAMHGDCPGQEQDATGKKKIELKLRARQETGKGTGNYHALERTESWSPGSSAIIVCDMWDLHHCLNATLRGGEMAPRMNKVLNQARGLGFTIIHAPSSCIAPYKNHPARKRVLATPRSKNLPKNIDAWCSHIPEEDRGKYPIDQSDGGEDDDPAAHKKWAEELKSRGRNPGAPWKSQTDKLDIHDIDYISDNGSEVWSVLEDRKINNVVLLGVHTNMCVLGRPFGLRQMARNGKNVVLMRDMTDTMYNPAMPPFVSHFTGNDLIVEHIEKFVCPTITSDSFLGGGTFRFKKDKRPNLLIIMAEQEYKTNETLPAFAAKHLGHLFKVDYVHASEKERNDLPGIEAISEADIILVSVRRRLLPAPKMKLLIDFAAKGKPIVAIRTASHAFAMRKRGEWKDDLVEWSMFDQKIIGGNYTGHHGNGPRVGLSSPAGAGKHPILKGVDLGKLKGCGSLYKTTPLAKSATELVRGTIEGKAPEAIAWTNKTGSGGRVFYTSLGHVDDFAQPGMNILLRNALCWAAGLEIPE